MATGHMRDARLLLSRTQWATARARIFSGSEKNIQGPGATFRHAIPRTPEAREIGFERGGPAADGAGGTYLRRALLGMMLARQLGEAPGYTPGPRRFVTKPTPSLCLTYSLRDVERRPVLCSLT